MRANEARYGGVSAEHGRGGSKAGDLDLLIPGIVAARQRLQLSPSLFTVDLDAFDAAIRRTADLPAPGALGEYERALGLYAGDFLEWEFFTWLDPYRMDYRRRLLDAARAACSRHHLRLFRSL